MTRGIDKADVRAALTAEAVLQHFAIDHKRSGKELRFGDCPECGPRSRPDAVSVAQVSGKWRCLAHGCKGDLLAMVAGYMKVDVTRDFEAVLKVAGEIAGVPATDDPAAAKRFREDMARRLAERVQREAEAEVWRERRRREAGDIWRRLARSSEAGLAYLRARGVDAAAGDVRYGAHSVCVPLRDREGRVVNVVGRRFVEAEGEPKVKCLAGCTVKATMGDLRKTKTTTGAIVLVEGVMDWLSARCLWPGQLVLGASGADMLPVVAELAARDGWARDRGVHLVPHADEAGRKGVDKAVVALVRAGVDVEDVTYLEPDGDLNDHLQAQARAA